MRPFIISSVIFVVFGTVSLSAQNNNNLPNSLSFQYEGEDFISLVNAWQDIRIHNFSYLLLDSQNTEIYPAGEVLDFETNVYSTGYVFITQNINTRTTMEYTTQVDLIIRDSNVQVHYSIFSNQDVEFDDPELQTLVQDYEIRIKILMSKFDSYLQGRTRLLRKYHASNN